MRFLHRRLCTVYRGTGSRAMLIPWYITSPMYVDSHAHLEGAEFHADRDAVIQRARDSGVETIVCIGNGDVSANSHQAAFKIADEYSFIYTSVGVHPHEARLVDDRL